MSNNTQRLDATFKPGKNEKKVDLINEGEEEQMEVYGYRASAGRQLLAWLGFLATAGLLRLVCHWYPQVLLYLTHAPCRLRDAQKVLCVENYQGKYKMYHIRTFKTISAEAVSSKCAEEMSPESKTLRAYLSNGKVKDVEELRMVSVKKLRYAWDETEQRLVRLAGLEAAAGYADMHAYSGVSDSLRCARQSILTLFLLEVVNPRYIFQVFSLTVWFLEGYYYYTIAIILMSVFGVTSSISQTRKNQRSLHDTVHKTDVVTVDRGPSGGGTLEVETTPGDVIVIPPTGCDMYCDAVLLSGSCIVNESMLTGESVPVMKTPLPKTAGGYYNSREDSNHTLFCGTEVMQSRGQKGGCARALVLRTGYLTAKGELVRSTLYPPPADFRFDRDVSRFIIVLGVISTCGLIYTIVSKSMRLIRASDIAIKALDIFTIVIPPALPATMTVGKLYGQKRLEKARIFCINSRVINVSGSIDCICFDKTGTLTEDGLDMWGVVEADPGGLGLQPPAREPQELADGPLRRAMACCHSLSLTDGETAGDPLDVRTLTFPSCESSLGQAGFKFSLSTNADIEGPQGSFECVRQNSSMSLEPLGALPCKMRIHAKDDVYDRTRDQLAKAEENQKRNCTREIKPGGPGIGKKVKLRGIPSRSVGNTVPPAQKEKDLPVLNTRQPPASKPFPSNVKPSTNGYLPAHNNMSSGGSPQNSIRTKPSGNTGGQKTVNTDIMRRPLRERLIHLLAVRPYKKPQVYERLRKDGITEKDRKFVADVLKQVAFMRENTFHLIRSMWNDVQEDWPFYTEMDRQMMKRNMPQNLTPPGSSDGGSSGSGHSPTSTHPGSPPQTVSSNLKRPGYFEGADGLPSKKHRVSHYRKPDQQPPCTRTGNNNNNNSSSGSATVGLPSLLDGSRRVNTPEHDEEENRDRRAYGERDNLSSDRRPFSERDGPTSDRRFSDRESALSDRRSLAERNSTVGERRPLSGDSALDRRPSPMETDIGSSDRRYCGPDRGSISTADRERRQFASDNVSDSVFSAVSNKEMSSNSVHCDTVERSAVQCLNRSPNTASPGRSSGLNGSNKTLREESVWGKTESSRVPSPSAGSRNSGRYQDSRNDRWNGSCNNSSSFSRNTGNSSINGVASNTGSGGGSSGNRNMGNNVSNRSNSSNNFSHSNSNSDQRNGYSISHAPSSCNAVNNPVAATVDTYSSPHSQQEAVAQPLNGRIPFPDYLSNYTKIMNSEQRSKYKADFNADYSEYRRLHSEVEKVSQRFAHLEKCLNQQVQYSSGWKSIQKQIIREYEENKRDQRLQDVKKRFQYLHEKLSHIKRLVSEYDAAQNCN